MLNCIQLPQKFKAHIKYFSTKKFNNSNITPWIRSLLMNNGSVIVSNIDDIYTNLSIEEWLYQNYNFSENNEKILLLWRNNPAVVLGRHQNVWSEVMIDYCEQNKINIARRNSGGGCVYHDLNNLNISFITSRKLYDREKNLNFIKESLQKYYRIDVNISPRKDLCTDNGEKISGTASKLNSHNSYHHCTLLVDVDKNKLRNALRSRSLTNFESNATKSIPSSTINLKSLNQSITIESLIETLSENYSKNYLNEISSPSSLLHYLNEYDLNNFSPKINDIRLKLKSWNWIYGMTPKFKIDAKFIHQSNEYTMTIIIDKGVIQDIKIESTLSLSLEQNHELEKIVNEKICFNETNLRILIETRQKNQLSNENLINRILLTIYSEYKRVCS